MNALEKEKPGAGEQTGRKLITATAYHVVTFLAKTFERPFWFLEQWRGQLADRLDNEGGGK